MSEEKILSVLDIGDFNLIANKDPRGSYDRKTRENLYWIIEKMRAASRPLSSLERRLYGKFEGAAFAALEAREKKVKLEVARYRLSRNVKQILKLSAAAVFSLVLAGTVAYQFVMDAEARQGVDMAYYAGLKKLGLVSHEDLQRVRKNLKVTATALELTKRNNQQLSELIEQMILNNKVTENLKYILKQVYGDPRTHYIKRGNGVTLTFNHHKIARYKSDPELWYLLGIIETGVLQVYYDNDLILEIEAIFGRTGEETPVGEYEIKNKVYNPTWYKKENIDGRTRIRAIPFGHPDHEIGHWWLGLRKMGESVPGSYGIHGVNLSKVNEFYKKNFDWRNGSAGCPNIQAWYLRFLGKVLPLGTRVNIVPKDKWGPRRTLVPPSAA